MSWNSRHTWLPAEHIHASDLNNLEENVQTLHENTYSVEVEGTKLILDNNVDTTLSEDDESIAVRAVNEWMEENADSLIDEHISTYASTTAIEGWMDENADGVIDERIASYTNNIDESITNLTNKDLSLDDDIDDLDDRVSNLENELLEETKYVAYDLSDTDKFSVETRNNYSVSVGNSGISSAPRSIILNPLNNYTSYCFIPDNDIIIYCDATNITYYAIAWLTEPANSNWGTSNNGTTYVKAGQASTRYRNGDNNLPTKAAPLTIPADSQVVITITAGKQPILYVQEATVRKKINDIDIDTINARYYLLNNRVNNIENDINQKLYTEGTELVEYNLTTTKRFVIEKYTGRYNNVNNSGDDSLPPRKIQLISLPSGAYDTYCFIVEQEVSFYVSIDELIDDSNANIMVTYLTNPTENWEEHNGELWKYGDVANRYRDIDSNLPSIDNLLTVPAGTQIAISVRKDVIPKIYVLEPTIRSMLIKLIQLVNNTEGSV